MARRYLRLSTRVILFFGVLALVGGAALAGATYLFARTSLLDQRTVAARQSALDHARTINSVLGDGPDVVKQAVFELDTDPDGFVVVLTSPNFPQRQTPLSSRAGLSVRDLPDDLVATVERGQSGERTYLDADGTPWFGVGIFLEAYDVGFIEAFPLGSTQATLRAFAISLTIGAALATVVATIFGWSISRSVLRPLSRVADTAGDIASGSLDARMQPESDPDLNRLAGSFNDMADAVQERIGREQRFASDVSHELRSPITALTAAVEVLDARRDDLPERTQQALDVVVGQVRRFDQMVIDLLELSRLEAHAPDTHTETLDLTDMCERVIRRAGYDDLPIVVDPDATIAVQIDRLRFDRILGNLLDNAAHHGGGPIRISIEPGDQPDSVLMAVEDAGPGVAASEKSRIFERFARGSAARNRIGTGLGLALVAEHAVSIGGEAWAEDRPGGGARFVVRFVTGERP
ncbi:MAG: two-component sensor histidine kinase [Ilumatobacter coccineus]|uniref:histidine kinase n=1 Tax=Ilumatobacter coccineus TaxID=467094 RepID=A0A2G6K9N7_9ACTN|nr:MAG: two-component sensor histidine kinase [Ilumatobacter coccineus]